MPAKQTIKFGDICREVKITTKDPIADGYDRYIGLEHLDSGSLKIKRWGMIAEDNPSFTRVFKKGHILFGKRRPYLKKAAVAEFDGVCSGDVIVLEGKKGIENGLLPFLIHSDRFWEWSVKTSSGSLSPRTKFKALAEFVLHISDKETQKNRGKILAKALEVNDLSHNCSNSIYKLKELLVLYNTYSNHNIRSLKQAREIDVPEGWSRFKMKDLAENSKNSFVIGPFGSDLVVSDFKKSGYPVVFVKDVLPNKLDWISDTFVDKEKFENLIAHHVKAGDVIFTKMGIPPGIAAVYPDDLGEGIITADIIRLRPNKKIVMPEYLSYVANSRLFKQQVRMITAGQTRPKLTLADFKNLVVYLPSIDEQKNFLKILKLLESFSFNRNLHKTLINNFLG